MATLQILLQARFGIFLFIARAYLLQTVQIPVENQLLNGLDITVEEDAANQRLYRIRKDRLATEAAALALS
ncbi:hypothetical protein CRX72_25685 [Pantoea sp. BRM17]|nr:hypothetical protein CRX72_25685 [Pantoea sp. BRM17]